MSKEAYVGESLESQGWGTATGDFKERTQLSDDGKNSSSTYLSVTQSSLANIENAGHDS